MGEARIWVGSALKQLRAALSSALYSANRGRGLLGRLGSTERNVTPKPNRAELVSTVLEGL